MDNPEIPVAISSQGRSINLNGDCVFCEIMGESTTNHTYGLIPIDILPSLVAFRCDNFVLSLDIAPIVPNHCLVVTNKHIPGFAYAGLAELEELKHFMKKFTFTLANAISSPLTVFEHSTPETNKTFSCCINHAHMHIVPIDVDFTPEIKKDGFEIIAVGDFKKNAKKVQGLSYLYYKPPNSPGYFFDASDMPSQYLRFLYSKMINREIWGWHDILLFEEVSNLTKQLTTSFRLISQLNFKEPLCEE